MAAALGFGYAPAGMAPAGFGQPATTDVVIGSPMAYLGAGFNARRIDPETRDYVIDEVTGRIAGMSAASQQVFLALATVKGSSADSEMGQEFYKNQTSTQSVGVTIEAQVRQALSLLTTTKAINLLSVESDVIRGNVSIRVDFIDLATGARETASI